eukprot:Clim_evm13s64 gene=Clim_evmTU13s64
MDLVNFTERVSASLKVAVEPFELLSPRRQLDPQEKKRLQKKGYAKFTAPQTVEPEAANNGQQRYGAQRMSSGNNNVDSDGFRAPPPRHSLKGAYSTTSVPSLALGSLEEKHRNNGLGNYNQTNMSLQLNKAKNQGHMERKRAQSANHIPFSSGPLDQDWINSFRTGLTPRIGDNGMDVDAEIESLAFNLKTAAATGMTPRTGLTPRVTGGLGGMLSAHGSTSTLSSASGLTPRLCGILTPRTMQAFQTQETSQDMLGQLAFNDEIDIRDMEMEFNVEEAIQNDRFQNNMMNQAFMDTGFGVH